MLLPFVDLLNHPSVYAVGASGDAGARFAAHSVHDATVTWALELGEAGAAGAAAEDDGVGSGAITMRSPPGMAVEAGDELWTWYGNAGWGAETPEAWDKQQEVFIAQYGFSPWE